MLAMTLALLLPLALAACGEAGDEDEDEKRAAAEERSGFPARARDADGVLMPRVYMPDGPDTILPDAAPEAEPAPDEAGMAEALGEDMDNILAEISIVPAQPLTPAPPPAASVTRVRALDKITARVTELDLPQDTEVRFGTLAIRARTCRSRPPEEQPETFAYLEIDDVKTDQEHVRVFAGWMMASSPALNALEHPVYDVWVIACNRSSASASSASE